MDSFFRMVYLYDHSSIGSADRKICDVLLKNLTRIDNLSLNEVAEMSYTSVPSVQRVAKTMKYSNFSDLKLSIINELAEYRYKKRSMPLTSASHGHPYSTEEYFDYLINKLTEIKMQMRNFPIDALLGEIHAAKRLRIYPSHIIYSWNFLRIDVVKQGKDFPMFFDFSEQLQDARTLDETCLVIMVLQPDRHERVDDAQLIEAIKHAGAKLFIVTAIPTLLYERNADYYFVFNSSNSLTDTEMMNAIAYAIREGYRRKYTD